MIQEKKLDAQEKERKATLASVVFMLFGLVLVFGSFAVVHEKKDKMSMASVSPQQNFSKLDVTNTIDYKRKMTGMQINNERVTAELNKEQELLNLGNKNLNKVQPQDVMSRGAGLEEEPNNLLGIHDRANSDRESYPDVDISREVGIDHETYDHAEELRKRDTKIFLNNLITRAEQQNIQLSYDPKTGEYTAERMPQSTNLSAPVENSTPTNSGGGVSK